MGKKYHRFQAFLGASLRYRGERAVWSDEMGKRKRKKCAFRCHAILCERTNSLEALASVASYMINLGRITDK
jgi:hypothetical protein